MLPSTGLAVSHEPTVAVKVFSGSSSEPPPGVRAPVRVPSIVWFRCSQNQTGRRDIAAYYNHTTTVESGL